MPRFEIPPDYLQQGIFTDEQKKYYELVMTGERISDILGSTRATEFWDEFFGKSGPKQCNSWFMDAFLRILEASCDEVGALSCMFSETFQHNQDNAKFVDQVSEIAFNKIQKEKLYEKRFLVSFFNINSHWHWYIIDNYQKICYIGDSFNQHAFIEGAHLHVQPPPLLRDIINSYRIGWKALTQAQVSFETRAVVCPSQAFGDSTSCGQYACASVLTFISRVFHDNLPVHRYAEPLVYPNDPVFIKQRLVMSYAYCSFMQSLNLIVCESAQAPIVIEDNGNDNNTTCFRAEVYVPSVQTEIELPPFQFPESFLVQITPPTFTKFQDPVSSLVSIQENYFHKKQSTAQSKVLIGCEINENWRFQSYPELLVAVVASYSNVNKKGVSTDKNPKNQAMTDNVIAKAALIWNQQKNVLLDKLAWMAELNRTQYNTDLTKIDKAKRILVKSTGIWRVTQVGFDTYLKIEPPAFSGPCIYSEVQNCKGRKSKSNSQKILTKMQQLRLESTPYTKPVRTKTWIALVKEALSLTHCPLGLRTILDYVVRGTPEADLTAIRQGVNSGKKGVKKRAVEFYEVSVTVGKTERNYCGLITAQKYQKITPNNEVYTDSGKPCIVWKVFLYRQDQNLEYTIPEEISGCLSIPEDCHCRVFSVDTDTNRLFTRLRLYCGTLIEKSCDINGQFSPTSMLNYATRTASAVDENVEEYCHFGVNVLRVSRDIEPGEYICLADPFAVIAFPPL